MLCILSGGQLLKTAPFAETDEGENFVFTLVPGIDISDIYPGKYHRDMQVV